MADDKKNIGPEAEKPGEAPQEKKPEPIKDTPPAPEQSAPVPKVLDFGTAPNKVIGTTPEKNRQGTGAEKAPAAPRQNVPKD